MSTNTFIGWFFCWIAAFKIDFHLEHDPWCESKPPILACDGTHISVSIRNMDLQRPVTEPDFADVTYKVQHKRGDCVLIRDASARKHLDYLCHKRLKKIKEKDVIDVYIEMSRTREMLQKVFLENKFDKDGNEIQPEKQELYEILLYFTGNLPLHKQVLDVLVRVLYRLSGDAALSSVVPFPAHDILTDCCNAALNNTLNDMQIQEMKRYGTELAQLLILGQKHNCIQIVVDILHCLLRKIKEVHEQNRPAPPAQPIPNTYNPLNACAYYFIESGEQLCKMPTYQVSGDKKGKNTNFADMPEVDPACSKLFPKISRSGFGYYFSGSAQCMGTAMGSILLQGERVGKTPFHLCTSIVHTCQKTIIMTLLVSYQSIV